MSRSNRRISGRMGRGDRGLWPIGTLVGQHTGHRGDGGFGPSGLDMVEDGLDRLLAVGQGLDRGDLPLVFNGGVVEPGSAPTVREPGLEEEHDGEQQVTPRRAEAGAWAAGGSATARSGTASTPASIVGCGQVVELKGELSGVADAYPGVWVRCTPDSTFLLNVINPIQGLPDCALLVTAWPNSMTLSPTSWAWWTSGFWIGDRHTNYYPAGSICAFEMEDGTWKRGQPAVTLLDLQAVWIARHLFLRRFGRWPGRQILHTAHERLVEQEPDEYCGCDSGRRYGECCRDRDRRILPIDRLREYVAFRGRTGRRAPPRPLVNWLVDSRAPTPAAGEVCAPTMVPRLAIPPARWQGAAPQRLSGLAAHAHRS